MRRILFWLHLLAGVSAGLVILVMAVTGMLLGFERQIVAWADRQAIAPVQAGPTPRLPAAELLAAAARAGGGAPATLTWRAEPLAPVEASFSRDKTLFLDPNTGALLGEGSPGMHAFFTKVEAWHRWLGAAGTNRALGRGVTGACNLLFLFVVASGPFLWLPRRWSWSNLRAILLFRGGVSGRARDWNWHNVTGIWCAVPLFFVVVTAVVMSYPWATNLLYSVTATTPPPPAAGQGGRGGATRIAPYRPGDWANLEMLLAHAKGQSPDWRSIAMRVAPSGSGVAFTIDEGSGGQPHLRGQLLLDRKTGQALRWEPFSSNNAGRRLRTWARFIHTGEAGGSVGQAIGTAACAGAALLVWTGLALAWRRFRLWRRLYLPPPGESSLGTSASSWRRDSTSQELDIQVGTPSRGKTQRTSTI